MAEILRDFCIVSITLEEQFSRYDNGGNLSYAALREMLGDEMNRGILWRLKDTAHHLLRNAQNASCASKLLDWAIGYIFHESLKLLEDTHLHQYYAPSLLAMAEDNPSPELNAVAHDFALMAEETQEEMGRTVGRMRRLLAHARLFFLRCYADQRNNLYLARLMYDREDLVREALAGEMDNFRAAVYGKEPHLLFLHAAISLAHSGKTPKARMALKQAKDLAPDDPQIASESQKLLLSEKA